MLPRQQRHIQSEPCFRYLRYKFVEGNSGFDHGYPAVTVNLDDFFHAAQIDDNRSSRPRDRVPPEMGRPGTDRDQRRLGFVG